MKKNNDKNNNNQSSLISKKTKKNSQTRLPPLTHNRKKTIINNIPREAKLKLNNYKETNEIEKVTSKIKNKTINKGKCVNHKNLQKKQLEKAATIDNNNDNKIIINEESEYEDKDKDKDKRSEKIEKINNNKNNYVFHFHQSNNLFIFIKNSKTEDLFNQKPNLKNNENYEIITDFSFPPAYKPRMNRYPGMPQCLIDTCYNGNIAIINNEDNCNVIWKLLPPGKMRDLIRKLGKNQKFNHFPSTYQIGLKDNMYKHFKLYKKLFPNYYNFVPETFILPNDSESFENIYKKSKKSLWIVKPVNISRGRGVHLLKDLNELKYLIKKSYDEKEVPDLISRYLDKPHLINNKKYDLRIYVLVTSFSPLRIYIYYNGLVRFATENYQKGNYDNIYIHITNYSINKHNINYKPNEKNNEEIKDFIEENKEEKEEEKNNFTSKWSLVEYRNYFKKMDRNDLINNIWAQIEDIIIKSLLTVSSDNCKEISVNKNNSLFELYGYDILIDESFKAWLLEVNVNPSLHCTSPLDLSIKTDLVTDVFNIIGILPFNHNYGEPVYNYEMMKDKINKEKEGKSPIKKEKNKNMKLPKLYYGNNSNSNDKDLMALRLSVVQKFNIDNLKNKIPEYDNKYYKNIIEIYREEKLRANLTGFSMIFPKKENIEFYSKILAKEDKIIDTNIVLWEYILNNE